MLKHLILNKKKIPIPVPVRTLNEAINWVESYLVDESTAITKIELDGEIIEDLSKTRRVSSGSSLRIQVDSPISLALQTIDALNNLSTLMYKDLKHGAVTAWQSKPADKPVFVDNMIDDLELIIEMIEHVVVILEGYCGTAHLVELSEAIAQSSTLIRMAVSQSDWKRLAKVMLNKLEPRLEELQSELISLQSHVYDIQASERKADLTKVKSQP